MHLSSSNLGKKTLVSKVGVNFDVSQLNKIFLAMILIS